ncbi:RNA polymerase sigma factor [Pontibacter silvestris]|uniref:RNA polymerase sigma factor n=1 Tax=Pontibacter silvestris TaxID=2305183 RepID=A0ABW4WWX6_9BACT|nr:sigma-70 family RNA polymerase sigma factor [Pontibacter silvestris]MCC9136591.1 sigma-70 family RNA polymerase sigma factor [Pontibacter silvestris]
MQTITNPVMASDIREALILDREKTLENIYVNLYPVVLHYVRQRQGTAEDAQDLVQESVMLFYEKVMQQELELTSSATTYIMAVCKNRWRRELEKRNRQQELSPEISEQVGAEEQEEEPDHKLAAFVEQLGEKCSKVLVSFYYLGQRMEEIAEQLNYGTVRSATVQKYKCLERLRKSLAAYTINHFR